jgi:uncharacterized protein YdhG (YjbR/CyaY superfamily)
MRKAIKEAAPDAVESISYGMPFYSYRGRLAWVGLAKAHIGLYLPPPVIELNKKMLVGYETTKSTVRLPLDRGIPFSLVRKLVQVRARMNEARIESARTATHVPNRTLN